MAKSEHLTISEAAKVLEVSEKTLRIWDKKGSLVAEKTEGGHRRYRSADIKNFIKNNDIDNLKSITDEFLSADLLISQNVAKKDLEFWDKKNYIPKEMKEHDRLTLAVLLSNQMGYQSSISEDLDDEFFLKIIVEIWKQLKSRYYASLGAMVGPTGLFYYLKEHLNNDELNISIESDVLVASSKKCNTKFFPTYGSNKVTILDKNTFETKTVESHNFIIEIDQEDLIYHYANKLAQEIDNEIISDLWANAEIIKTKDEFLKKHLYLTDYIITNQIGLELLKQGKLLPRVIEEKEDYYMFGPQRVILSDQVDGMIFGKGELDKPQDNIYHYHLYVPISISPQVIKEEDNIRRQSFMMRYAKKLVNKDNKLFKLVF